MPRPTLDVPSAASTSESAIYQHSLSSSSASGPSLKVQWEPGCQPDEVYDRLLPSWRASTRRFLVRRLREQKDSMADWQKRIRSEGRDRYFYWTAIFGTHTFFVTFFPMLFFFGYPSKGRDMINIVGLGIYFSSVIKDLVCAPRPYSPPMLRLSMSTHHQEYGFPSSHSTNSVSIALLMGQWMYEARDVIGLPGVLASWLFLTWYASSVVGGRVYTGMHSIDDIIAGILIGVACWAMGVFGGPYVEVWLNTGVATVPLILITVTLLLIHVHPEPVDDCPCFEDSIAVMSGMLGTALALWHDTARGCEAPCVPTTHILEYPIVQMGFVAIFRIILGIGCMFAWRLLAKTVLLQILPPIFRFVSTAFDFSLPTRRFYTPATDYHEVPPTALRPIPSLVSLHQDDIASADTTPPVSGAVSPVTDMKSPSSSLQVPGEGMRQRKSNGTSSDHSNGHQLDDATIPKDVWVSKRKRKNRIERAHYDADVLTKWGVYTGMGFLAGTLLPELFAATERGLFKK